MTDDVDRTAAGAEVGTVGVDPTGTAVTVVDERPAAVTQAARGGLLRPVARPEEIVAAQEETRQLVAAALQEGRDYGTIPGTSKPTLYKPGAERINAAFGMFARFATLEAEVDHDRETQWSKSRKVWRTIEGARRQIREVEEGSSLGLYRYVIRCTLHQRSTGNLCGEGIGSCSSLESKYCDRPRDLENTVLKMAQKRAYIAATLLAYGLSDQFTQDIEDDPDAYTGSEKSNGTQKESSKKRGKSIDDKCPFRKAEGRTWRQLMDDHSRGRNSGRGLVMWYLNQVEDPESDMTCDPDLERALREYMFPALRREREEAEREGGGDRQVRPRAEVAKRFRDSRTEATDSGLRLDANPVGIVIPPGSVYAGMTIAELLSSEPGYVDYLLGLTPAAPPEITLHRDMHGPIRTELWRRHPEYAHQHAEAGDASDPGDPYTGAGG